MSTDTAASPFMLRFLSNKRHRWVAGAVVFILFVVLAVQNHEALLPPREMSTTPSQCADEVDWSRFAYTQYVTNSVYLCNSVMFFESLHRLSSRADRVMMYPSKMLPDPDGAEKSGQHREEDLSKDARLLIKARDEYNVKLVPITVQHKDNADATWADSFTKLLAFNQTQYRRVLSIDSDSLLLQHMDELFLLPPSPVAMPRAYWLLPDEEVLSSQLVLLEPSDAEFARVMAAVDAAPADDYDMEIVNRLYRDSAMVLPHRPYDLLTGEFRGGDHARYLGGGSDGDGDDGRRWDPAAVYSEAKLVHFSDWPLPKPWLKTPEAQRRELEPECVARIGQDGKDEDDDCTARLIWNSFYAEFKKKRKVSILLSCHRRSMLRRRKMLT